MKNFKIILFSIAFIAAGLTFSTCGDNTPAAEDGKEFISTYVCPMHCEGSGSEEPGNCPVCGMEYVKKEIHTADGHEHERHKGHDH